MWLLECCKDVLGRHFGPSQNKQTNKKKLYWILQALDPKINSVILYLHMSFQIHMTFFYGIQYNTGSTIQYLQLFSFNVLWRNKCYVSFKQHKVKLNMTEFLGKILCMSMFF